MADGADARPEAGTAGTAGTGAPPVGAPWQDVWTPTGYARNGAVEIAFDRLAGRRGIRCC